MLARQRSQPIKYRVRDRLPITERLQSISLKSRLNFLARFNDNRPKTYNIFRFLSWRLYKKDTEKTKRAKESSNASMLPSKRPSSNLEGLTDPYYGHECCIQHIILVYIICDIISFVCHHIDMSCTFYMRNEPLYCHVIYGSNSRSYQDIL